MNADIQEFTERASRIASIFFSSDTNEFRYLVFCIQMELRWIAKEAGWQKDLVKKYTKYYEPSVPKG